MGLGKKTHKKADQETQSPMLKVFKEIKQLTENVNNPEKAKLLKERREKKKKRFSSNKSVDNKSGDTTPSERQYKDYKVMQHIRTNSGSQPKSQSIFHSEKRDSWWAWGGNDNKSKEDTCSCVSCALKKILTSQRTACLLCVAAILALSGVVAICVVCETMPKTIEDTSSMDLRRTNDVTTNPGGSEKRERRSEFDVNQKEKDDREIWDESKARLLSSLSELDAAELRDSGSRDPNELEGSKRAFTELSSILDPNKIGEGYSSNTLRNFYHKLIKTEMQIKKLKKSIQDNTANFYDYSDSMRPKRSLKSTSLRPKESRQVISTSTTRKSVAPDLDEYKKFNIFYPPASSSPAYPRVKKNENKKRQVEEPSEILLEKKRLSLEYQPNARREYKPYARRRKVAQCSHSLKDSKSHENELKHPFYKNSARLDEILDRLIEKNVPDLLLDTFGIHAIDLEELKFKQKNKLNQKEQTETNQKNTKLKTRSQVGKISDYKKTTPRTVSGVITVATILSPDHAHSDDLQPAPHLRKLLQVEDDEENEDLELNEAEEDRTRRREPEIDTMNLGTKYPFTVNNPNWKGPMPLYPDELNSIIKQAAMENMNKVEIPPVSTDNVGDIGIDLSDTEYVEDYTNNKYDKLVELAQAYSDYGVLEDKKETRNDKSPKALDNRIKLSVQRGLTMLERLKKNERLEGLADTQSDSEGIRFEIRPKNPLSLDPPKRGDFFKLGSHLKIGHELKATNDFHGYSDTSTPNSFNIQNYEFMFTSPQPKEKLAIPKGPFDQSDNDDHIFLGSRHKRSLKSLENNNVKQSNVENDDSTEHDVIYAEYTIADINDKRPTNFIHDKVNNTNNTSTTTLKFNVTENITKVNMNKNVNEEKATSDRKFNNTEAADLNQAVIVNSSQGDNVIVNISFAGPSEILGLIADWFLILNALENDTEHENDTGFFLDTLALINPGFRPIPITPKVVETTTNSPVYPMIDSEMIDNIGHRSRVLMSVEEKAENITAAVEQDDNNAKRSKPREEIDKLTNATLTENVNITNANKHNLTKTPELKTVVKRSATDNNLIFWNDMYDDEYGIKEPLDDAVRERDKPFAKYNDVLEKSENWLGVKLRKISDSVRNSKFGKKTSKQPVEPGNKIHKVSKRSDNTENLFAEDKQSFAALTANMKKVCHDAAEAVHQTKHTEVRSENEAASNLMGQLVGLMSDLVEIQVQQKTCVPLPPDLRSFLVWLTSSNLDERNPQMQQFDEVNVEAYNKAMPPETVGDTRKSPAMYPPDVRTECLGTIHDVQHLIELYDEMSEEDKSKMSGVREYLENQLEFLHKQLSTFEGYNNRNYPKIQEQPIRRRRHLHNEETTRKYKQIKRPRRKRKVFKFIKSFGKKRTRSTLSYDDTLLEAFTESMTTKVKNENEDTIRNEVNYVKRNDEMKDENGNEMKYVPGIDERKDMNANDEMRDVNERDKLREGKKKDAQKRNLPLFHRGLHASRNATTKRSVVTKIRS